MSDNVTKHCATCGSSDLKFDADAVWDVATQTYAFIGPHPADDVYCVECMDAVDIEERPIAETLHTPEPEVHNPGASPNDYIECTKTGKHCHSGVCIAWGGCPSET